jgi:hypothetical protein
MQKLGVIFYKRIGQISTCTATLFDELGRLVCFVFHVNTANGIYRYQGWLMHGDLLSVVAGSCFILTSGNLSEHG